ncbi:tannase/feruloyl esterase family alpha/beta hydrolase [Caulobacter sp. Root1455]|uniref:tannase/feruloyl esterase family alpha/beta hydrolase n=1 Tax=Caulobacter sp. Root1455 TaxID=1736465 RepID=UPI0009E983EB|nr:tannase/feruloyl esterase family alpha/beta hydrolase [Caulobacter sp. Root1455]
MVRRDPRGAAAAGLALLIVGCADAPAVPPSARPVALGADACAALRGFTGRGVRVVAATAVTPSPVWSSPTQAAYNGVASKPFCRVEGVIQGRVGFELWLPAAQAWSGRLLGAGVGGDAGIYNYADLGRGVDAGFAAVTTDSGHKAADAHWMLDRAAVDDYTHRAQHLTNQAARALVEAYYGRPAAHAYFLGCSGGGRQGLKEVQDYPGDYDGVVVGAPGPNMPPLSARMMWLGLRDQRDPAGALNDADWSLVAKAAVAACDRDDGLADGLVANPPTCRFDPAVLACSTGTVGACLTPAKLATVRITYAPLRDEAGKPIDSGVFPGVRTRPGPPSPLLRAMFADGAHRDSSWDAGTFTIAGDLALAQRRLAKLWTNKTDLSAFRARGGKLLIYQGWLDPSVIAQQSLEYYAGLEARTGGGRETRSFARLMMAPGLYHCLGGTGPDRFGGSATPEPIGDGDHDALSAMVAWVEQGRAPERIVASQVEDGQVTRQRPLCVWPSQAVHIGGDPNKAESFRCAAPGEGKAS